jgi:single-strand DNA-binding protein
MDVNSVVIIGRLTRDAVIKYLATGTAVSNLSIAQNYRKKSGETWVDEVNFFDVNVYGKQAESLGKYLLKGKQIAVTGELRQERWMGDDGKTRSKVTIIASGIQLLGSKNDEAPGGSGGAKSSGESQSRQSADGFNDDIPF